MEFTLTPHNMTSQTYFHEDLRVPLTSDGCVASNSANERLHELAAKNGIATPASVARTLSLGHRQVSECGVFIAFIKWTPEQERRSVIVFHRETVAPDVVTASICDRLPLTLQK